MFRKLIFPLLLLGSTLGSLSFIPSCNKDKNLIIVEGTVKDPNTGINVEAARVVFSSTKVTNGVYNSGFTEVARTTTDASGKFSFEIEEERASMYRIAISKENYFSLSTDISGSELVAGTPYYPEYSIYPIGYIKLHIVNTAPIDDNDAISYTFSSGWLGCYECCDNTLRFGYGVAVDQWWKCKTFGNQNVVATWNVTKNSNTILHNATIYCIASDTVTYEILY